MERNEKLTLKVKKYSKKIGVDVIGFADPNKYGRFSKYNQPISYLKNSKTVIILGLHLHDIILDAWNVNQETGKNNHFADSILEKFCNLIKDLLFKQGYESKVISYNPGLFLKDSAALAGIGPIGENNLLITEQFGSQVRLRALITTAPLVCGVPILESDYCKECDICIKSCPADAFPDGEYNKGLCLPYQLSHFRKLSDETSIWCNICIESCPIGKNRKK